MTTTVRTSRNDDLFFIGLGAAAGVAVVFAGLAIWQVAVAPALTGVLSGAAAPGTAMLAQEAQAMGLPLVEGTKAFWYVARAGGILAYMLLWLATLWGVFISSKMVKGWIDGTLLYDMHEFLPIVAVVFAVLHAAVLLGDAYIGFSVLDLLVPFRAPIARCGQGSARLRSISASPSSPASTYGQGLAGVSGGSFTTRPTWLSSWRWHMASRPARIAASRW